MPALPLIVFFTYRVSLDTWRERGILERETALYRRLLPDLGAVTFITYGAGDGGLQPRLGGIRVLPRPRALSPAAMSLLAPWLYRRDVRAAAVLKTNQASGAWTAILAKWLTRRPLVVRCGYAWSFNRDREGGAAWRRALIRLLERLAVRAADLVVVTTREAGAYLVTAHGVAPARLRVVPNHVDVERFAPGGAERDEARVLFVGRLSPEKNLATLVDAVAAVPGLRLDLIGAGPERETLARRAAAAGARVQFRGTVPNDVLPRELNRAAMFALPSRYEGQPKALLEAMACGLPVLGADVPGIRELVRHGETGWLCAPDAAALAAGLRDLRADPALRHRLGKNARAMVEREFSLDAVAARELAVLREAASLRAGHEVP
jgi:glycosyltransferase involved in cell wall biosynthesis